MFERVTHGAHRAPVNVSNFHDPIVKASLPEHIYKQASDELELLDEAGEKFSEERIRAGKVTPVFFGSAANNFGVQMMLDRFLTLAPPPAPRSSKGHQILPSDPGFSGFIFKIQANMNPKHRDRVAFIRIVSGEFKRDMNVINTRNQKPIRLANSQRLFAQERETVDTAWAGDVVGIVGNNDFLIGDTLADDSKIAFDEMPRFAPECFAWLHNANTAKFKRFREGLDQLLKEGLAQAFELFGSTQRLPLLGAVGPLQFEVLKYRLESEYGAECRIENTSWSHIRWFRKKNAEPETPSSKTQRPDIAMSMNTTLLIDSLGNWVTVFPDKLSANYFESKNSDLYEVSSYPF
jgi:peptide chain release factor 3